MVRVTSSNVSDVHALYNSKALRVFGLHAIALLKAFYLS